MLNVAYSEVAVILMLSLLPEQSMGDMHARPIACLGGSQAEPPVHQAFAAPYPSVISAKLLGKSKEEGRKEKGNL